jgi:hypothetical protein
MQGVAPRAPAGPRPGGCRWAGRCCHCSSMLRCMLRCRKGLVRPSSTCRPRPRRWSTSARSAWYSGCSVTQRAAIASIGLQRQAAAHAARRALAPTWSPTAGARAWPARSAWPRRRSAAPSARSARSCGRKRSALVARLMRLQPISLQHAARRSSAPSRASRARSASRPAAQPVVVRDVARPRHDLQVRKVLAHQAATPRSGPRRRWPAPAPRLVGAGHAQQVQPGGVAVEGRPAEAAHASTCSTLWSSTVALRPLALSSRPTICP